LAIAGCGGKAPPESLGATVTGDAATAQAIVPAHPADPSLATHLLEIKSIFRLEEAAPLPLCQLDVTQEGARWLLAASCRVPASVRGDRPIADTASGCRETGVLASAAPDVGTADGVVTWSWRIEVGPRDGMALSQRSMPTDCLQDGSAARLVVSGLPVNFGLGGEGGDAGAYWQVHIVQPAGMSSVVGHVRLPQAGGDARVALGLRRDFSLAVLPDLGSLELSAGRAPLMLMFGPGGEAQASALGARLRRGLETIERLLGPAGTASIDIAVPAVVVLTDALAPFQFISGAGAVFVGFDPGLGAAPPSISEIIEGTDSADLMNMLLLHHPARLDVLELHILSALARERVTKGAGLTPFGEAVQRGFGGALALAAVAEIGGDKARRRYREFAWTIPWQQALTAPDLEPLLADGDAGTPELLAIKAAFMAEASWRDLGADAGRTLTIDVLQNRGITPASLRSAITHASAVPGDADRFIATWLDGQELAVTLGAFSVARFIEYALVDGGLDLLKASALEELTQHPELLKSALGLLSGDALRLDPVIDLVEGALDGKVGDAAKPWVQSALDAGRVILGVDSETRRLGADRLVDELGDELGLDADRRAQIRSLADEVFKALDKDRPRLRAPTDPGAQPTE